MNISFRNIIIICLNMLMFISNASAVDVAASLNKAIAYLHDIQSESGEFPTYITIDPAFNTSSENLKESPYITSYVLYSLYPLFDYKDLKEPRQLEEITEKGLRYLSSLALENGLWKFEPSLPPDIDNTACALIPFILFKQGEWNYGNTLTAIEENATSDGLLLTFIRNNDIKNPSPGDLDLSVYANICLFYGLLKERHQPTIEWLNAMVPQFWGENLGAEINKWAIEPFTPAYLVTRAYFIGEVHELEPAVETIREWAVRETGLNKIPGESQLLALLILTLLYMEEHPPGLTGYVEELTARQNPDGSWAATTFFRDFKPQYYGSFALSTALAIEALTRYLKL
ncbi:hypothetical protein JW877_05730 [bacterium]|nr:hypothetical protein [bacterium]